VFCLPSIVEGRALVVQEAMSRGLPVIVTANTGADDVVEDGHSGFVVPMRSPEAVAEKIAWFAAHPEARDEMGRRRYPWSRYAAAVLEALAPASGGHRNGTGKLG
jgi:glycosyltransferase involved in cell wall biosynthesis